ncbi:MAG TPA: hypothetical protein VGX27_07245 [Candidatus Dormibacteraeota bacterium]|nr:hypothetical protein [Candidatus Dormibacteraeota bacterium]
MNAVLPYVEDEMGAIRIEADGGSAMADTYSWFSRHRNQVVTLDAHRSVRLGVPISGARAVIVAAVLDNGIGGVLRALVNLTGSPIRLVFDVRARGGHGPEEVRSAGAEVLDSISRQISEEESVYRVA